MQFPYYFFANNFKIHVTDQYITIFHFPNLSYICLCTLIKMIMLIYKLTQFDIAHGISLFTINK